MPSDAVPSHAPPDLGRVLGPMSATCIVVGAIVGVGIFFTPSDVAALSGSGGLTLLVWCVGGVIALAGALTFAELGGSYPRSAGQYEILRDAYGALPAFLFVFCNATAIQAGAMAVIGLICAQNAVLAVTGADGGPSGATIGALALIAGLTAANVVGVRLGAGIQNTTVIIRVLTLGVIVVVAAGWGTQPALQAAPASGIDSASASATGLLGVVFTALVPAFFAFGGWQHALWIGGEIRRPQRNVPLAIVAGVGLVVAAYVAVNWAYLRLLGHAGVSGSAALAADAVGAAWPWVGRRAVAGAVALSAFGVLNAQLLSGPRLIYGMARDGRFFRPFAAVSPRFGTPAAAVVLLGALAAGLLLAAGEQAVQRLVTGVVFIDGVFFALTGLALVVLRRRRPDTPRPVRVPGYPLVPLLFVIGEIGVVAGAYGDSGTRHAAVIGLVWIAAAALIYGVFFARRSTSGPGERPDSSCLR